MFCRNKRTQLVCSNSSCNPVSCTVIPQSLRSFDAMCVEEIKGSSTGEKILASVDDIYLLLMQKDFQRRYPLEYRNFVQSMITNQPNIVKSKLPKLSDKQLMSYIKSRHLQHPSELVSWFDYLSNQYDLQSTELKNLHEEFQSKDNSVNSSEVSSELSSSSNSNT